MREGANNRRSSETDIRVWVGLDGGETEIDTSIGFFDHMLEAFAKHSGFGLKVSVKGDLWVDCHHTIEDTGIVMGKAFADALGDKSGIARYGSFFIPMDESLAFASVDVSGRPFLRLDADFPQPQVGQFESCMVVEFLRAFAFNAGITLHAKVLYGENSHHMIEALFKAIAHALKAATASTGGETLSTKGMLD